MKSATKGTWRSIRCLLLVACAGGVLAADNTWVSAVNLSFANRSSWFSSIDDSPDTLAVFDYSEARSPRQVSMGRLLDGLLFERSAGGWTLASSATRLNSSSATASQALIAEGWSEEPFLETRSESSPWSRGPVSGGGGDHPVTINAAAGSWIGDNPGTQNWSNTANWAGGIIADGSGAVATITFNITGLRNVNLDTSRTIGSMTIGDADGSHSFTVTASTGAQLNFDNGSANALLNQNATSAGDTISAPILLFNSLDIQNASANPLTLSGPISSGLGVVTSPAAVGGPHSINVQMGDVIISGSISDGVGGVSLTKTGAGTLTLSGTNTYSGVTSVFGGTLLVNGDNSGATGTVFVSGNGTVLGGTDTVGGDVYMFGSTITGHTTSEVGTLTLNENLVMATGEGEGGTYLANLSGTMSDLLAITGNLTLGMGTTLSIQGAANGTTTYILATFADRNNTMFETVSGIPANYTLVYNDTDILLVPTAIPEPSTWIGGALAIAAIGVMRRRRRGQKSEVGSQKSDLTFAPRSDL